MSLSGERGRRARAQARTHAHACRRRGRRRGLLARAHGVRRDARTARGRRAMRARRATHARRAMCGGPRARRRPPWVHRGPRPRCGRRGLLSRWDFPELARIPQVSFSLLPGRSSTQVSSRPPRPRCFQSASLAFCDIPRWRGRARTGEFHFAVSLISHVPTGAGIKQRLQTSRPHRLVVRTSRCGHDNPGSTPGVVMGRSATLAVPP